MMPHSPAHHTFRVVTATPRLASAQPRLHRTYLAPADARQVAHEAGSQPRHTIRGRAGGRMSKAARRTTHKRAASLH